MKELSLELRLELEYLMEELASANSPTAFFKLRDKAIDLKKRIESWYESQT